MRQDEFARLIDEAVGTLRREAGEAWSPVPACADAAVVPAYVYDIAFASPYAIADGLQLAGDSAVAAEWLPELPEEIVFSEVTWSEETIFVDEIVFAEDESDLSGAAIIAAKFARVADEAEPLGEREQGQDEWRERSCLPLEAPEVRPWLHEEALTPPARRRGPQGFGVAVIATALLVTVGSHFMDRPGVCRPSEPSRVSPATRAAAESLAASIVIAESGGDANAKNERSSATGAGQFLDGTWLDMIRAHRPDLKGQSEEAILELRHDADLSREMVARFAEGNAAALSSRCLPVTPGTLYLAHFAGGAGASAVLSAPEDADAASTIAGADSTGRLTREKIVTANPFLQKFTVADLKHWADRKMIAAAGRRLSSM